MGACPQNFPPKLRRMRLPVVLIYLYPLRFSVILHCCQIKSKIHLISNPCHTDVNDVCLHTILQGASIPAGSFFPGSQSVAYMWLAHFYWRQVPILPWPPDFLPNSPNTAPPSAHCKAFLQHIPSLSSLIPSEPHKALLFIPHSYHKTIYFFAWLRWWVLVGWELVAWAVKGFTHPRQNKEIEVNWIHCKGEARKTAKETLPQGSSEGLSLSSGVRTYGNM